VFALALVPRLFVVLELHPPGLYVFSDMAIYDLRADRLARGEFAAGDTFTPIGYPAFLAAVYFLFGKSYAAVGWLQALAGAATCGLAHLVGFAVSRSAGAAALASIALAFHFPLVVYTGLLLTESLFALLLVSFAWLLVRAFEHGSRALAAASGLVLAAAAITRPQMLVFLPLLLLWGRVSRHPSAWRAALVALAVAIPPCAAVSAYASRLAGRPVALATNGGVNFFLAHAEIRGVRFLGARAAGAVVEVSTHHSRKRHHRVVETERAAHDERYFYAEAFAAIARRPGATLARAAYNLADGLGLAAPRPWPEQPFWPGWMGRDGLFTLFAHAFPWLVLVPVAAHTALLAWRRSLRRPRHAARLLLLLLLAALAVTLALLTGNPRVRVAFDPLLFCLAGAAWVALARALSLRLANRRA
jgi:4-amino-4-deoxy-L-arabinose transferase-like glycosyltransferase